MIAKSPQAQAIQKLARMLAGSSTFQDRCGLDDVDVMDRIYIPGREFDPWEDEQPLWPCATIELPAEGAIEFERRTEDGYYQLTGLLELAIWDRERNPDDPAGSFSDFIDFEGCTMNDILQLANVDDNLVIHEPKQRIAPALVDQATPEGLRFHLSVYAIDWTGYVGGGG